MAHSVVARDPSLRLMNGYGQEDAIDERTCHHNFKLTHYSNFDQVRCGLKSRHSQTRRAMRLLGLSNPEKKRKAVGTLFLQLYPQNALSPSAGNGNPLFYNQHTHHQIPPEIGTEIALLKVRRTGNGRSGSLQGASRLAKCTYVEINCTSRNCRSWAVCVGCSTGAKQNCGSELDAPRLAEGNFHSVAASARRHRTILA